MLIEAKTTAQAVLDEVSTYNRELFEEVVVLIFAGSCRHCFKKNPQHGVSGVHNGRFSLTELFSTLRSTLRSNCRKASKSKPKKKKIKRRKYTYPGGGGEETRKGKAYTHRNTWIKLRHLQQSFPFSPESLRWTRRNTAFQEKTGWSMQEHIRLPWTAQSMQERTLPRALCK